MTPSSLAVVVFVLPAVTEAGKAGDALSEDFFREEYILNNAIGIKISKPFLLPPSSVFYQVGLVFFSFFPTGTYKKPYIALIDGITMGGVSIFIMYGSLSKQIVLRIFNK